MRVRRVDRPQALLKCVGGCHTLTNSRGYERARHALETFSGEIDHPWDQGGNTTQ